VSPYLGTVKMRSVRRFRSLRRKHDKRSAWELWKALPQARPYLRPYRRTLILVTAVTVLVAILGLAEPWPLAVILNSVLHEVKPSGFVKFVFGDHPEVAVVLVVMVVGRFLIVVIGNALTVFCHYRGATIEQNMVLDLRSDLFAHVQRLSLAFHDKKQTGALMSQINTQAASLGTIVMVIPPILESVMTLIGMLTIVFLIDWQLALLSLIIVPVLYWSFGAYGRRIVPRLQRVQELEWRSLSIVHEAMSMLRVIVSFGREDYEHRRFREQGQTAVDERVKLTVSQSVYTLGVQTATAAGASLILAAGSWAVIDHRISIGELIVLMTYIASVYQPLEQMSATVGMIHEELVQFHSSLRLLATEPEVCERPDAVELVRARGEVTARTVAFAHQRRESTLCGISFQANPGERIAVVGHTGAGKSTLMSLLIRFYDPDSGSIEIDGVDIRDLKLRSLRSQFSVVLQDPLLFSGTIEENIRYGKLDASHDEIVEAAKAANAHSFIERLPDGYQTALGERGAHISGGERQRVCVARAFLRDAPILILDEPTSSIDSRTEGVILDALDDLMVGRTSFMVAHRLSTVRHVDQILVMNDGRIVERGNHDELVAQGGIYCGLYDAQTRERHKRSPVGAAVNGAGSRPSADGDENGAGEVQEVVNWRQVTGASS
jgi:ABC-type multidrug transport system fused ATPase/permease subunit